MAKFLVHVTTGPENATKATWVCSLQERPRRKREGEAHLYLSGMSAKARGLDDSILAGWPAEFAMPNVLVRLAAEADTTLCY